MKLKHALLTLGAAAVLGAASAAHAIVYFGPGQAHPSSHIGKGTYLALRDSGHMLIMPYYNAQDGTATLLSITNSDQVNGKAISFQGVGGLLNGILLLAPGDTWSAMLSSGVDGHPVFAAADPSCMLITAEPMHGSLLDKIGREHFFEIHGMADIPPGSDLFKSLERAANGRPKGCGNAAQENLLTEEFVDAAGAARAGLAPATGGLSGNWIILNQTQVAAYSGAMTAIRAEDDLGRNAYANIRFSPQILGVALQWGSIMWGGQFIENSIENMTADVRTKHLKSATWAAFPDLSTPLIDRFASPEEQVEHIANGYAQRAGWLRSHVENSFVSDAGGAVTGVPMSTDWIVSMPLMRYYVGSSQGNLLFNTKVSDNPYKGRVNARVLPEGNIECMKGVTMTVFNNESEKTTMQVPDDTLCNSGASVLSFAPDSVINASKSRTVLSPGRNFTAGWASLDLGVELPVLGYALTHYRNNLTDKNYGATMPHR